MCEDLYSSLILISRLRGIAWSGFLRGSFMTGSHIVLTSLIHPLPCCFTQLLFHNRKYFLREYKSRATYIKKKPHSFESRTVIPLQSPLPSALLQSVSQCLQRNPQPPSDRRNHRLYGSLHLLWGGLGCMLLFYSAKNPHKRASGGLGCVVRV